MLKLKRQYFGYRMWRADSLENTLILGKMEGRRRDDRGWDGWMASPTRWTWVWASSRSWWWTVKPTVLQSMGLQSQTWLSDWTATKIIFKSKLGFWRPHIWILLLHPIWWSQKLLEVLHMLIFYFKHLKILYCVCVPKYIFYKGTHTHTYILESVIENLFSNRVNNQKFMEGLPWWSRG